MELPGYAGTILHVDLTSGSIRKEPIDAGLLRAYIGGAGIIARLAFETIPPDAEPLSPQNAIIMGTGPFNGTMIPGASRVMVIYRSPLNGAFPISSGGGYFSHYLKSSGYDHIVITGQSERPTYLKIQDDTVELCDARELWGRDVFATTDELRRRHRPCSVIPIGPAGENLVNISVTQIDKGGTLGSGGLCAVMGSKKLKAIVAGRGTKGITVAEPRRLRKLVDEILERVKGYHLRDEMMRGGSMTMTTGWFPEAALARNSSALLPFPANTKEIQSQMYELHKQRRKKIACITCPMADKDRFDLIERGMVTYDTAISADRAIMTLSPAFGHRASGSPGDRYADTLSYFDLVNRCGIDRLYGLPGLVDFVVTLYEDGIITKEDTGGLELDRGLDTLIKLVGMVARREGFGDVMADGILGAARRMGKEEYVQNVIKGQCVVLDPRIWTLGPIQFAQMVFPGRALGVGGGMGAPTYSPGWSLKELRKQAERCGVPEEAMGRIFSEDSFNVGRITKHGEDFFCLFNMLGQCHRLYISRFYSMGILAELYSAVTGVPATAFDLKLASERTWNLWKLLNYRAGFTRKEDEPPEIWFQPLRSETREYPLTDFFRTHTLTRADVERLLDDYYDERGWDKGTGIPTGKKLRELGLESLIRTEPEA